MLSGAFVFGCVFWMIAGRFVLYCFLALVVSCGVGVIYVSRYFDVGSSVRLGFGGCGFWVAWILTFGVAACGLGCLGFWCCFR